MCDCLFVFSHIKIHTQKNKFEMINSEWNNKKEDVMSMSLESENKNAKKKRNIWKKGKSSRSPR